MDTHKPTPNPDFQLITLFNFNEDPFLAEPIHTLTFSYEPYFDILLIRIKPLSENLVNTIIFPWNIY